MTLTRIDHHTTVVAVGFHDGQLLIANLHVIEREVEMQQIVKEVQVRTHLVIPRFLRLVTDGFLDGIIVGGSMLQRLCLVL